MLTGSGVSMLQSENGLMYDHDSEIEPSKQFKWYVNGEGTLCTFQD